MADTQRINSPETLAKQFQYTIEMSQEAVFWMMHNGQFTYVNDQACRSLGYTREELLSLFLWDVDPDFPKERWHKQWDELTTSKQRIFETRHRRKDGHIFPVEVSACQIVFDGEEFHAAFVRDVTARKQAVEKLKETEQKLRLIVEHSTNLFYIHTPDNILTYVSPQSRQFFDCEPEEAMLEWTELISDNPLNTAAIAATQMALKTGQQQPSYQVECLTKKGRKIWAEVHETPIIENNMVVAIAGSLTDITERKQVEEALRKSEEMMRSSQSVAHICSYSTDLNINNIEQSSWVCSPEFYNIFGIDETYPHTIAGWANFIHPDHREEVFDYHESVVKEKKSFSYEYKIIRINDGAERWVHGTGELDFDEKGNPVRMHGAIQDITERKQAEEALRKSEEMMRSSQSVAHICSYSTDLNINNIEQSSWVCSPEFYNIFGIDETYPHTIAGWANFIHPDHREEVFDYHESVVKEKKSFSREYKIIRINDGAERWVHGTGELDFDEKGNPVRMHGAIQDITERRWAAAEKEKLQSQLVQAQKLESIGQLAGGVAHDFNNMLSVIIGRTEMALKKTDRGQPLFNNLLEIRKAAERSANLTRQLLAFARKQTIVVRIIDLNEAVEGMLQMLRRLIGEHIDLTWQPSKCQARVKIDPSQIDQILANLCVNARDAIDNVGKITIETDIISFDEAYCATNEGFVPGDYVLLAVSDNGCGISQESISHLFEPFFTTKELGKGTGLGLASVYGAIKQNNGFINVYSEVGQGTTFKIYLPQQPARTLRPVETATTKPIPRANVTILLVEDEPAILSVVKMILEDLGYVVITSSTPSEALRLAREHGGPIDLLMTDVVMPEMNGRDLAENLLSICPDIKCLFMSGYTANVIAHHGVLDKDVYFIQKPFSSQDVGAKLQEVLGSTKAD